MPGKARTGNPTPQRRAAASLIGAVALACVFAGLAGCKPNRQPNVVGYFGPTEPLVDVVEAVNANNRQLPTLWAKGYFEANLVDDRKRNQFVNGDAILLLRKPYEFKMVGRKDVAGQVFELGTTKDEYWMIVRPEADTMWWGTYDRLDQADPAMIPIRPDLLMQVLAVGDLDTDLARDPAPVMRFNNDADAYMLVWVVRTPSRVLAQREVWYDRQTKRPKLVLLFDENGRIVVRAYLSAHKPVADSPATVATHYQLFFPESGTRLELTLNDVKLTSNGVPREGSIRFPGDAAGVSNIVRVDDPQGR